MPYESESEKVGTYLMTSDGGHDVMITVAAHDNGFVEVDLAGADHKGVRVRLSSEDAVQVARQLLAASLQIPPLANFDPGPGTYGRPSRRW